MVKKSNSIEFDTQGTCFFCLEESDKKQESRRGARNLRNRKCKTEGFCSIVGLCKWLKLTLEDNPDDNNKLEISSSSSGDFKNVKVYLCQSCKENCLQFTDLLLQLEQIKMEVEHSVRTIRMTISKASRTPSLVDALAEKMMISDEGQSLAYQCQFETVNQLRNRICEEASKRKPNPVVRIDMDDQEVDEEDEDKKKAHSSGSEYSEAENPSSPSASEAESDEEVSEEEVPVRKSKRSSTTEPARTYTCPICKKGFANGSRRTRETHQAICGRKVLKENRLKGGLKDMSELTCRFCKEVFQWRQSCTRHEEKCKKNKKAFQKKESESDSENEDADDALSSTGSSTSKNGIDGKIKNSETASKKTSLAIEVQANPPKTTTKDSDNDDEPVVSSVASPRSPAMELMEVDCNVEMENEGVNEQEDIIQEQNEDSPPFIPLPILEMAAGEDDEGGFLPFQLGFGLSSAQENNEEDQDKDNFSDGSCVDLVSDEDEGEDETAKEVIVLKKHKDYNSSSNSESSFIPSSSENSSDSDQDEAAAMELEKKEPGKVYPIQFFCHICNKGYAHHSSLKKHEVRCEKRALQQKALKEKLGKMKGRNWSKVTCKFCKRLFANGDLCKRHEKHCKKRKKVKRKQSGLQQASGSRSSLSSSVKKRK